MAEELGEAAQKSAGWGACRSQAEYKSTVSGWHEKVTRYAKVYKRNPEIQRRLPQCRRAPWVASAPPLMAGCQLSELGLLSQRKKRLGERGRQGHSSPRVHKGCQEKGNNLFSMLTGDQTNGNEVCKENSKVNEWKTLNVSF